MSAPRPRRSPTPPVESSRPLAGVSCPFLTAAVRRVEAQCKELRGANATDVPRLLAALALAADRRDPTYVADLSPRPSLRLGRRLLQMLQIELLRAWQTALVPAFRMVRQLVALDGVRKVLDARAARRLGAPLADPDGLEFFVEVMHDLRSPLSAVLFLAETLQRGQSGAVNELQRRQLGLIYGAALGLSSIATGALELASDGDRLDDDTPVPFSVTEVMEQVRDIVRPMAEEKGLTVNLLAPATDQRLGYPLTLNRVLLNLTTNALKFTATGFVELSATETAPTRVQLAVRDTGPGIPAEAMATLYQPFQRTITRRGDYRFSSTGLGLAISRQLVEAMGAKLELETRPGWGTRFFCDLELPPVQQR